LTQDPSGYTKATRGFTREFVELYVRTLTLGCVVSFGVLGLVACEQQADQTTATPAPAATTTTTPTPGDGAADMGDGATAADGDAAKAEVTPAMVCATLLDAAKAKDDAKFLANATDVTAQAMSDAATKETIYTLLGGTATCGDATVEGERATVPVTVAADKRDIPFVKIGDAWKFDSAEYMNKYPAAPEKGKKGKKGKAAKGKHKAG
jgi:hypothetical protein